jgi:hypothetical protein
MHDSPTKRSPRLKLAIWWLAAQTVVAVLLLVALDFPAESKFVGIVIAAVTFWVLYGVWNFRRWAKYPLIALLILALLIAAVEVPNLPELGSLGWFIFNLLYAAANKIAYDELKRATSINPPLI